MTMWDCFLLFSLPLGMIIFGFGIRLYEYKGYKEVGTFERHFSTHGMNFSWIDITQEQWKYLSLKLAPKAFLIAAAVGAITSLLFLFFLPKGLLDKVFIMHLLVMIVTLIVIVKKAEKHKPIAK